MIVITGASGFIGSALVSRLNEEFYNDLVLVDDFSNPIKNRNISGKKYSHRVDRRDFFRWLGRNHKMVQFVFHIGARTDTTEFNWDLLKSLNLDYTKKLWRQCTRYGLPLVYASSAATYGDGSKGYSDDHDLISRLEPLNPYGRSKNEFDKWALAQDEQPWFWTGLKFFNVYGPNEYHKGRMASVIFHAFHQVRDSGKLRLFRSHKADYADGEQKRDFIYVKDVVDVLFFLLHHRISANNGIYNLGTGKAESFNTLGNAVFKAMEKKPDIAYINIPEDIRDKYQYFTQAGMDKLRAIGYQKEFTSLEKGVQDYVSSYLMNTKYL